MLSVCSETAFIQSRLLRLFVCFTAAQLLKAFCFISCNTKLKWNVYSCQRGQYGLWVCVCFSPNSQKQVNKSWNTNTCIVYQFNTSLPVSYQYTNMMPISIWTTKCFFNLKHISFVIDWNFILSCPVELIVVFNNSIIIALVTSPLRCSECWVVEAYPECIELNETLTQSRFLCSTSLASLSFHQLD